MMVLGSFYLLKHDTTTTLIVCPSICFLLYWYELYLQHVGSCELPSTLLILTIAEHAKTEMAFVQTGLRTESVRWLCTPMDLYSLWRLILLAVSRGLPPCTRAKK